jgi:phosphoribosylformylglycinamidine cyclo-ligase
MNDVIVMGAKPIAVLDTIICNKIDPDVVTRLISSMSQACREHDCNLVGGETSEQPGVVDPERYILSAAAVGVVDKWLILDGSCIMPGDEVWALPSNGPHTNGYSLIRKLVNPMRSTWETIQRFQEHGVLNPHTAYYPHLKDVFGVPDLHGLAHITGGGIRDNLKRILPPDTSASVNLSQIKIPSVFNVIREVGGISDEEMLRTFNVGVGMIAVVTPDDDFVIPTICKSGCAAYKIGEIIQGDQSVGFTKDLHWET